MSTDSVTAEPASESQQVLGLAATLPVPEPSVATPSLPTPDLDGLAGAIVRDRVFEALFGVPAGPQRLGRYVVLGTLGRGGMGTVLEAFDRTLDRRVAIKVLHHDLGERHRARLIREAQALAKLSHPNVVQVYEVSEADEGQVFIAMELVRGRSLTDWLAQQDSRPSWRECVEVYLQAGEGLAAAHAEGLVHRDFKPSNAVIDDKGRVRVLDFGLARQAEDFEAEGRATTGDDLRLDGSALSSSLTRTGTVLGTPAYMPLEQMDGQPTDARSDQFSFCVSLHEALYGERPFEGRSMEALMLALRVGKVRPASRGTTVPEALRKALLRGLAKDPADRWPSMAALLTELRRLVAPRRRAWWALGVAGGLTALGVGLWQYAEVGFRCEGARAKLDGIWDEARKQEVKDAILGTGLSYAQDTWGRVEQRLDEYTGAWAGKHTEICEATSVRQEQSTEVMDLRMACLRDRKVALREAVEVLAEASPTRVENAVELVAGLPGLSRCDDAEALRAELPLPDDPGVAERVERLRARLLQASSLHEAGAIDEGLGVAEEVVAEADALGYAPLLAEAWLERGSLRAGKGEPAEAERDLERAYLSAAEHGHASVERRAAAQLVWVVGSLQSRHEAGLQWGNTALALARARGVEPEAEAQALGNIGTVLALKGELDDALAHHRRALAAWEGAFGPEHPMLAGPLVNIGMVLHERGEFEDALSHYRRALATLEHALGPRHPRVAESLSNIGDVLLRQDDLDGALDHHRRALDIMEQALGAEHPNVATVLDLIGVVRERRGELSMAITLHRRALAIREQALGPDHPAVAISLSHIAIAEGRKGQLVEAADHHRRALAVFERALGSDHPNVATSVNAFAGVLERQGRLEEAGALYQRGLGILERAMGPEHPRLTRPLIGLATVALARHHDEAARADAERALAILQAAEVSAADLADARYVLAQALWSDASQRPRARALAEESRDGYAALGQGYDVELATVRAWLAEHPAP